MTARTLGLLLAGALLGASTAAPADELREQRIKTAFLVNFVAYVTWPPRTFASPDAPVELCVLADDAFGRALADVARNKVINDRPLRISRVFRAEDLQRCHIAYLENADAAAANLAVLAGHHVVSVYEGAATQSRGVIRFYLEQDRVRFEVNVGAAKREDLQLSAKLLGLARIVEQ